MQRSDLVVKQFEDQINDYTEDSLVEYSAVTPFLASWVKKNKPKSLDICEFGGGGGNLLEDISKHIKIPLKLTNAELVAKYKLAQANKMIRFVHASVLDSKFQSDTYDVTIVRNVLHHLVAYSHRQTRDNQMDGIRELIRVTKRGGLIVIEEQTNNNLFSCLAFFYLSQLASTLKIRIDRFQITPNTIVGYMKRSKLQWMCERHMPRKNWIKDSYEKWSLPWYWRVTGLMEDTGESFIVMRKP